MNKRGAIAEVIRAAADRPIVFTTGYACRIACAIEDRPNHFYMTGSMGLAANIAQGIALTSALPVVVVDGDGSLTMNPSCLLAVGADPRLALLHLVLDDGMYESTGRQPVPSCSADLPGLAAAAGYRGVTRAEELPELAEVMGAWACAASPGTVFVHCVLDAEAAMAAPPRIDPDLAGLRARFSAYLRAARHGT